MLKGETQQQALERHTKDLSRLREELATHILEKHNGIPSLGCHFCNVKRATIQDCLLLIARDESN